MEKEDKATPLNKGLSYLNEKQAAPFLGLSIKTLQAWRHQCRGPRYRKFGRSVRYSMSDLVAFAEGRVVEPIE